MFKEIIQDFKDFTIWFSNWFFYKRQSIKMNLAIKLADIKQKAFNKQYHIMLLCLPNGEKLVSVNRDDIERLKRKKMLPKDIRVFSLKHSSSIFYSTPLNRNNKASSEDREAAKEKYLKYAERYMKKAG